MSILQRQRKTTFLYFLKSHLFTSDTDKQKCRINLNTLTTKLRLKQQNRSIFEYQISYSMVKHTVRLDISIIAYIRCVIRDEDSDRDSDSQ